MSAYEKIPNLDNITGTYFDLHNKYKNIIRFSP